MNTASFKMFRWATWMYEDVIYQNDLLDCPSGEDIECFVEDCVENNTEDYDEDYYVLYYTAKNDIDFVKVSNKLRECSSIKDYWGMKNGYC